MIFSSHTLTTYLHIFHKDWNVDCTLLVSWYFEDMAGLPNVTHTHWHILLVVVNRVQPIIRMRVTRLCVCVGRLISLDYIFFHQCAQQRTVENFQFAFARKYRDITICMATFAWITIFLLPKEFVSWKIDLYLDWSRLIASRRLFTHLKQNVSVFFLCMYTNVRLLSWQIIIYSCWNGSFYALFERLDRLECLTSARGMTQFFFFLEFARYSNLGSKLLFFMFEELLCNSVTWKIRGKSSR